MGGLQQGGFAVKLCQLEEEYGRLQSRIRVCQEKDSAQVRQALEQLLDECREQDLLLEQRVRGSRMPAAARLAQAQLDFWRQAETLARTELEREMRGRSATPAEDQAEASALFAEFAIDFATQAMRYALCACLRALELQAGAEEAKNQEGGTPDE